MDKKEKTKFPVMPTLLKLARQHIIVDVVQISKLSGISRKSLDSCLHRHPEYFDTLKESANGKYSRKFRLSEDGIDALCRFNSTGRHTIKEDRRVIPPESQVFLLSLEVRC